MKLDLDPPDLKTLSRRNRQLNIGLNPKTSPAPIYLVMDSTGFSIVDQGEWAAVKHDKRGKRG